jgi:hypothetical protein
MHRVTPVSEEKKLELERELELQKERFLEASTRGLNAIRTDLSILSWMRAYPRETAILIMVGGFTVARLIQARRNATRYGQPQEVA